MIEAEFITEHLNIWINDIDRQYHTTTRIIDCIPWGERGCQAIFEIGEEPFGRAPHILHDIERHPDVTSIDVVDPENGRLWGVVGMHDCCIIRPIVNSGCFLEMATADGFGKIKFNVVTGSNGSLPTLIRRLDSIGLHTELKKITDFSEREFMTPKQEEVLKFALERGYFDSPRRTTLVELGKMMKIDPSIMGEIIRHGERRLLNIYLNSRR
jgi:predicted DNA binding protein